LLAEFKLQAFSTFTHLSTVFSKNEKLHTWEKTTFGNTECRSSSHQARVVLDQA
jgi:hypothetical protein